MKTSLIWRPRFRASKPSISAPKTYSLVEENGKELSFEAWRALCQARGAQLGRIDSAEEQQKAFRVIKTSQEGSVLIDSRRRSRGSPIFLNSDRQRIPYSWVNFLSRLECLFFQLLQSDTCDWSSAFFRNWNNGEPNNYGGHQSCTRVYTREHAAGRWDDIGCNEVTSALCESRSKRIEELREIRGVATIFSLTSK